MKPYIAIVLAACSCSLAILSSGSLCRGDESPPERRIMAADLAVGRATIIGYLGHPLGEVVTIRGTLRTPPKDAKISAPAFQVTHVDGKPVASPLELTHYRVRPVNHGGRSGQSDKEGWDWKAAFNGELPPPDSKPERRGRLAGVENFSTTVRPAFWEEGGTIVEPPDDGGDGFRPPSISFWRCRIPAASGATQKPPSAPRATR